MRINDSQFSCGQNHVQGLFSAIQNSDILALGRRNRSLCSFQHTGFDFDLLFPKKFNRYTFHINKYKITHSSVRFDNSGSFPFDLKKKIDLKKQFI